jgi:Ca-activated chloride channel homolog
LEQNLAENHFGVVNRKTGKDVVLSLQHLELGGVVHPAGAHLKVSHIFESGEPGPIEAVYCFALPRDAALRSFTVHAGDTYVESKLLPRGEATELYEKGIEEGSISVLAQNYRDGVVNLSVGNLRKGEPVRVDLEIIAGVELRDEGYRFRFPFTLSPTYHPKARTDSDGTTGSIQLPTAEFGDVLLPEWLKDPSALHTIGCDLTLVSSQGFTTVSSPSHRVAVAEIDGSTRKISLTSGLDQPNRDLVVEIKTASKTTSIYYYEYEGATHFFAVTPSTVFGESQITQRRIVFVLDRSGSMQGTPITQAKNAVKACLGAFSGGEEFNIIAFDDKVELFKKAMVDASNNDRDQAVQFIDTIDARGGTELLGALEVAITQLKSTGGDIFLVTDGQVSGTENIIERLASSNVRVHTLGIGSASQDRFITLLSRSSGGTSRFLTPRERVDVGALEVFSSIRKPIATELKAEISGSEGEVKPEPAKTIYQGVPFMAYGRYSSKTATLRIKWSEGTGIELSLESSNKLRFDVVRLAQGARLITDEESASSWAPSTSKETDRIERRLRKLSEEYGLASRASSLVAVVKLASDKPGIIPKTRIVPVGMPEDVNFGSYFNAISLGSVLNSNMLNLKAAGSFYRMQLSTNYKSAPSTAIEPPNQTDKVLEIAAQIQADGSLPGNTLEERSIKTLAAYLILTAFNKEKPIFDSHLEKLRKYLDSILTQLPDETSELIKKVIKSIDSGDKIKPTIITQLLREINEPKNNLMSLLAKVLTK